MEKFAVDLDAVLDEFEYHEGQVGKSKQNFIANKTTHPQKKLTKL